MVERDPLDSDEQTNNDTGTDDAYVLCSINIGRDATHVDSSATDDLLCRRDEAERLSYATCSTGEVVKEAEESDDSDEEEVTTASSTTTTHESLFSGNLDYRTFVNELDERLNYTLEGAEISTSSNLSYASMDTPLNTGLLTAETVTALKRFIVDINTDTDGECVYHVDESSAAHRIDGDADDEKGEDSNTSNDVSANESSASAYTRDNTGTTATDQSRYTTETTTSNPSIDDTETTASGYSRDDTATTVSKHSISESENTASIPTRGDTASTESNPSQATTSTTESNPSQATTSTTESNPSQATTATTESNPSQATTSTTESNPSRDTSTTTESNSDDSESDDGGDTTTTYVSDDSGNESEAGDSGIEL